MKAEASWALLGLTCRLAQSLGLFRSQTLDGRESQDVRRKEMIRRRLWWTCLWHDTLTSLSFDRFNMTNIPCCPIPMSPTADTEGWAYLESMFYLNQVISTRMNPEAVATASYSQILENCQAIEIIREKVLPHIRSKDACRSAVDRLQHFAIRLHTSFVVSVCCRPALHHSENSQFDPAQKALLLEKCKENLTETVRMFLAMHQLSVIPTRSWAFTYHGLSSAVLLGIWTETKNDPEVHQLQGDLISALSATAAKEQSSPEPHIVKTDRDIELSGPLSRALTALKNIYDHGSVIGSVVKGESSHPGSGTRTPLHMNGAGPMLEGNPALTLNQYRPGTTMPLDPHQNAALAMAEMQQQQNGSGVPDFTKYVAVQPTFLPYLPPLPSTPTPSFSATSPSARNVTAKLTYLRSLPYGAALQQGGMDMSSIDPATYMSPMDLYDSIFWGKST